MSKLNNVMLSLPFSMKNIPELKKNLVKTFSCSQVVKDKTVCLGQRCFFCLSVNVKVVRQHPYFAPQPTSTGKSPPQTTPTPLCLCKRGPQGGFTINTVIRTKLH